MSSNAHSFYYGGKLLSKIVELIRPVVEPLIEARGDEYVDMEYVKEKGQNYLRIYVDREPSGIDIAEIADLSEVISEKLDTLDPDPLPDPYVLEVSSPGAERPIKTDKDWQKAQDNYIHVGLYQKLEGVKNFEGYLRSYDQDNLTLEIKIKTRKKIITIPRNLVAQVRFAIEF